MAENIEASTEQSVFCSFSYFRMSNSLFTLQQCRNLISEQISGWKMKEDFFFNI